MGERGDAFKKSVEKTEVKRTLARSKNRWKSNK
jgi:hypothetical protein